MLKRIISFVLCTIFVCAAAVACATEVNAAPRKATYTQADVKLLAKVLQLEAGTSSDKALVAVGSVVMNRMKHKSFPSTLSGVIYQKGQFHVVRTKKWKNLKPCKLALQCAERVLEGENTFDAGVLYFKCKSSKKKWGKRIYVTTIGNNMFYR